MIKQTLFVFCLILLLATVSAVEIPSLTGNSDSAACSDQVSAINKLIDEANYCETDSDCSVVSGFGCPFGCHHFLNVGADTSEIKDAVSSYTESGCLQCAYMCVFPPTDSDLTCINNKCVQKPEVACPEIYSPVCGENGETYTNECEANKANVPVKSDGECKPSCQKDSDCPQIYCFTEPCPQNICSSGQCVQIEPEEVLCPSHYSPVCGSDGKTYDNKACAEASGVDVEHEGECEDVQVLCPKIYDPVCGSDDRTYGNSCESLAAKAEVACKGTCPCSTTCYNGCLTDNICLPYGTRTSDEYCDIDKSLKEQKTADLACNNNYECSSNLCASGQCVDQNLFIKFLGWLKNLFG